MAARDVAEGVAPRRAAGALIRAVVVVAVFAVLGLVLWYVVFPYVVGLLPENF